MIWHNATSRAITHYYVAAPLPGYNEP